MKKAILINVGNDYLRYNNHLPISPPLGILAIGSYLAEHNVPVELIDVQIDFGFGSTATAERAVCQRVARYLQTQVDVIAWIGLSQLSNTTSGVVLAQEIHTALPTTPIIFGGYFPTGSYRLLLHKYPFITAIVRGDGEAAALQISQDLAQNRPFLCDQTPNLAWLHKGEIRTTPAQSMALDNLPILDFGLLHNRHCYQLGNIMTSRGCPFRCNYCLEAHMRPYASYTLEWVARQLRHVEAEIPNKHIIIADPIFGVNRRQTLELCQVMRKHPFTYSVESRVDVLSPSLIPPLRQAGLEIIFWGIESASPATLLRSNKVRSQAAAKRYIENALNVLRTCFENNVVPYLGLMLGFPGDLEADQQATLEFVKEVKRLHDQVAARTGVEVGFVPFAQPTQIYDGSALAERVKDFDIILGPDQFDGERGIISLSPKLSMDTIHCYEEDINNSGHYTPTLLKLISQCLAFSVEEFMATHPELTDSEGVTRFC